MFTKITRNFGNILLKPGYPYTSGTAATAATPHRVQHNWNRQHAEHEKRKKAIPKLVYLHNPWKYLMTKFNLWKLRWLWDPEFKESEFIEGSKQAAVVMTDIIREQSTEKIIAYTTPVGFQQISRDMQLSRNDNRLKLVRFEKEHLRRAIPIKVARRRNFGRKYAFIDMLFVGLRNTKDFDSATEVVEINEIIQRMDRELRTPREVLSVPHRIVFAEIFIRFRRDYTVESQRDLEAKHHIAPPGYPFTHQFNANITPRRALSEAVDPDTQTPTQEPPSPHGLYSNQTTGTSPMPSSGQFLARMDDPGWSVSFYKILTFDVLNYDPGHKQQR